MKEFIKRSITGLVYAAALLAGMLVSPLIFGIIFITALSFNLQEFYLLADKTNMKPQRITGGILGAYIFVASILYFEVQPTWLYFQLLVPLVFFVFIIEMYRKSKRPILNITVTIGGLAYIALPFILMTQLAYFNGTFDARLLVGVFVLMWISDSMAYIFGVTLGKHRLFERISPKKSWEGFIGGTLSTIVISYFFISKLGMISPLHWAVIGAITAIFGTFGDLAESMFKRSVHVKDSGKSLPGHGGFLDRFDSILFVVPMVYFYLMLIA